MREEVVEVEECLAQRTARERLEGLRKEMANLRLMQAQGMAPPADHPQEAHIEEGILRTMQRLEREAARPLSKRIPIDATPPREILRMGAKVVLLDDAPPRSLTGGLVGLTVVRALLEEENYKMACCFAINYKQYGDSLTALQETETVKVGYLPWSREMNSWTPQQWAWFLAVVLRRTQWQIGSCFLSYKLQDIPQEDFYKRVDEAFTDITYTERYASGLEYYRNVTFDKEIDVDLLADSAWAFDTTLWECACEYGLEVEDRSATPALTFLVGEKGHMVVDKTGKRWNSQTEYVRARLNSAKVSDSLSVEDAEKHKDFVLDVMKSARIKEMKSGEDSTLQTAKKYKEFVEEKLSKRLRRVARKYNMTIPEKAVKLSQRRCDHCNAAEGTKRDENSQVITDFRHCPCNPDGRPFYCGEECQKSDWPVHKEFCTFVKPKKSKPAKSSGKSKGKAKKKKSKK